MSLRIPGRLWVAGLLALLAGCPATQRPAPPAPVEGAPQAAKPAPGAQVFALDPAASHVVIEVRRTGALARLGHNHVITAQDVEGRIWLDRELARSGFDFVVPVERLVVDDDEARRAAGDDFPLDLSDADKDATRRNMLRAEVLDAEHYPRIKVASNGISGTRDALVAHATITIRDVTRELDVPVELALAGGRIEARGTFVLKQTDFGITPFTAALGALAIEDDLRVRFQLVGTAR